MSVIKEKLNHESIVQYKIEERSIVSRRLINSGNRIAFLVNIMKNDTLSLPENLEKLKNEIFVFTKDDAFTKSKSMGELMEASFDYMRRNYQNVTLGDLL
jgi:replicative DNA helicase